MTGTIRALAGPRRHAGAGVHDGLEAVGRSRPRTPRRRRPRRPRPPAHPDAAADPGRPCGPACGPRTTASCRSPRRPGGSTRSTRWRRDSRARPASRSRSSSRSPAAAAAATAGRTSRSPRPGPGRTSNWDDTDLFESTFDAFDAAGVKVWLQVEPARCDVPMLIELMYQQYGHHSSVIGFGVDDEWYRKDLSRTGKPVTDAEAQAWVARTRGHAARTSSSSSTG